MLVDFFKLIFFKLLALFFGLASLLLISRAISPEIFGKYSLFISILNILAFAVFCFPNVALLKYSRNLNHNNALVQTIFHSRILIHICFVCVATIVLFALSSNGLNSNICLLLWIGVVLLPAGEIIITKLQSEKMFLQIGFSSFLQKITFFVATLFSIHFMELEWKTFVIFVLLGSAFGIAFLSIQVRKNILPFRPSLLWMKKLIKFGLPMLLFSVCSYGIAWVDIWTLNFLGTAQQVGYYSWAYSSVLIATSLFVPLSMVVAPWGIDKVYERADSDIFEFVNKGRSISNLLMVLSPIIIVCVSLVLFNLPDFQYKKSIPPLIILLTSVSVHCSLSLLEPVTMASSYLFRRAAILMLICFFLNLFLDIILFKLFGLNGPAYATLLTLIFWSFGQRYIVLESAGTKPIIHLFLWSLESFTLALLLVFALTGNFHTIWFKSIFLSAIYYMWFFWGCTDLNGDGVRSLIRRHFQ